MAWTTINNLLVAVGAKPFATTIQALRDNPIAIAGGEANAPKVMGAALDMLLPPVDTTANAYGGWTDLDRALWIEVDGVLFPHPTGIAGNGQLQARLSSDNGATWSGASSVTSGFSQSNTGDGNRFKLLINIKTGAYRCIHRDGTLSGGWPDKLLAGTLALTGSPNALQLRGSLINATVRMHGKVIVGVSP